MDEICAWAHQVRIDPASSTARQGQDAAAMGSAMLALAYSDEPRQAHAAFWDRLQERLQDEGFAASFEHASRQLQDQMKGD